MLQGVNKQLPAGFLADKSKNMITSLVDYGIDSGIAVGTVFPHCDRPASDLILDFIPLECHAWDLLHFALRTWAFIAKQIFRVAGERDLVRGFHRRYTMIVGELHIFNMHRHIESIVLH